MSNQPPEERSIRDLDTKGIKQEIEREKKKRVKKKETYSEMSDWQQSELLCRCGNHYITNGIKFVCPICGQMKGGRFH